MRVHESESFIEDLKKLSNEELHSLRLWYEKLQEDGKDELLRIDLEIERRAKIARYYENHIY